MKTREFPTTTLISLTSMVLLRDSFNDIREAFAWILNEDISDIGILHTSEVVKDFVLEQHPDLPTELKDVNPQNVEKKVLEIEAKFGLTRTLTVED